MMLKQLRLTVFTVLVALFAMSASAQVNRVVVLPFDTSSALEGLQVGVPTAMQLGLHQLDGVFVPSIGDAVLVASKAERAEADVMERLSTLFNASVIVSGEIERTSTNYVAQLIVRSGGSDHFLQASGASVDELVTNTTLVVAEHVVGRLSDAQSAAVQLVTEQTPSEPSLYHLGFATAGLPGVRASDLGVASRLDVNSVWLKLEHVRLLLAEGNRAGAEEAFAAVGAIPEVSDLYVTAAVLEAALGNEDTALAHYNEALRINSANAMALAGRASLGVYPEADALVSAQEAVSIAPRLVEAHLLVAGLEASTARSVQALLRAEQHLPDSVLLRSVMVDEFLSQGDANGALTYLRDAVRDRFSVHPSMYALAGQFPTSHANQALTFVTQGLEMFPGDADLLLAQAELYLKLGQYGEAQNIAAALHETFPTSANVVDLYAVILIQSNQSDDAIALMTEFYGESLQTQFLIADFLIAGGQSDKARTRLEAVIADEPENANLRALYGTALLRLGRLGDAEVQLNEALRLAPEHGYATRSLAQLDQHRELLQDSEAIELGDEATVAFQQGLSFLDVEDFVNAAASFKTARESEEHGLIAFYQGYASHLAGDVRGAIDAYVAARADLPNSAILENNLGYAYLSQGRYDLALPTLRNAVELDPSHSQAHLNLGLTYASIGRVDDARQSFTTAKELDVSLTDAVNALLAQLDNAE